jgi:hypothetical protein
LLQGLLFDGTIERHIDAIRDLWSASRRLVKSLGVADGKDRSKPGPPSKEIGSAGVSGEDLFTFDICAMVYRRGGKLTANESSNQREPGGSLRLFFNVVRSLVPKDAGPTETFSRLKAIRNQARSAVASE